MIEKLNGRWGAALALAATLAVPGISMAADKVEERLAALETKMTELTEKVDLLMTSMKKSTVYKRQRGISVVEPESFMEGYFRGQREDCN